MNSFFDKLTEKMSGMMDKIEVFTENKYIKSIAAGMAAFVPFTVITGFAYIIAFVPITGYETFIANIFGDYTAFMSYFVSFGNATMNLGSIICCVYIAYFLAKEYNNKELVPIHVAVMAMAIYFFVSPIAAQGIGAFGTSYLFSGIIIAIVSTEIYRFFIQKHITIKLPPQVPENVASSFTSLIPLAITIVVFSIINLLCAKTPYGDFMTMINALIATPFSKIGTSIWGYCIIETFVLILWFFGLHGNNILWGILTPALMVNTDANRLAFLAGEPLPYILTNEFNVLAYANVGMWTCITAILFCKSVKLKTVGKVAVVPAIFRIDEPTNFGFPVMYNPIMWVPYFICNLGGIVLTYILTVLNIVPRTVGIALTWTTPTLLSGYFLTNGSWIAVLWQLILGLLYMAIHIPFLKAYDKRCLAEEAAAAKNE